MLQRTVLELSATRQSPEINGFGLKAAITKYQAEDEWQDQWWDFRSRYWIKTIYILRHLLQ